VIYTSRNISTILFSPNERWLVGFGREDEISQNDAIWIWDLEQPDPEASIIANKLSQVISLAISPDGRWLASGILDGGVQIWHMRPEELLELSCLAQNDKWQSAECDQYSP
jgi:WD40 repeat protein